jgi:hypothetical protein
MENLINLGHNEQISGIANPQEAEALNKALNPNGAQYSTTTPDNFNQGNVFMTESLEPSLKVVSEIEKHVKLFNMIDKSKAYQLVEEFNMQTGHGGAGNAWIAESDDQPREEDATYNREFEVVKYMGVKKRIHHIMTQIRSAHGDLVSLETRNGIQFLLRETERGLFEGNGFFSASGAMDGSVDLSSLASFSGLDKQLRKGFANSKRKQVDFAGYGTSLSHIIDIDADVISPENIEEGCRIAIEDNGQPSVIMLSPKAHSDFSRQYYPKERFNDGKGNITPGTVVPAMNTSLGRIDLMNSRFLVPKREYKAAADNTSCPAVPASVSSVDTNAAATDLAAGDYIYKVAACNKHGEGVPAASAGITAAAGDRIQIQIADPVSGAVPTHFAVYRSDVDAAGTTCKFIGYVLRAGATTNFIDLNAKKPACSQAYFLQMDADTMTLRQLTPMLKIDFAIIGLYRHWAQVQYLTPIVFKPNYNVLFDNISEGYVAA